jgi:hypothetical protein
MWKANGKTTTLSHFLDSLFPKTETSCMRDASSGDKMLLTVSEQRNILHEIRKWKANWIGHIFISKTTKEILNKSDTGV